MKRAFADRADIMKRLISLFSCIQLELTFLKVYIQRLYLSYGKSQRFCDSPNRTTFIFSKPLSTQIFGIILTFIFIVGLPAVGTSKTVTDQLGRSVNLPERLQRIVALAPSITEIVFALNMEAQLVGATQFSDYPPEAMKLPKVGSYVRLDLEKIVSLKPDLCIAVKDGNPISVIRKLDSLGIPVYAVDPRNLEAVKSSMVELGQLLGVGDRAKTVAAAMDHRIKKVRMRLSGVTHRPGVFFQIGITPIVSAGTPTFIHELIIMAGGKNLAQGPIAYPRFSKEQVIGMRPEVIIITSMARNTIFEQVKAQWQQWGDLPAIKNNRIHLVNSDVFDRASPRLVKGLEILAQLIHPTCFQTAKAQITQ
jgi:iron complex transport system substrate-binding protein